ncbi:hypothetical protein FQZ97_1197960 [compost metagenome]
MFDLRGSEQACLDGHGRATVVVHLHFIKSFWKRGLIGVNVRDEFLPLCIPQVLQAIFGNLPADGFPFCFRIGQ